jgi:hypothetical protein
MFSLAFKRGLVPTIPDGQSCKKHKGTSHVKPLRYILIAAREEEKLIYKKVTLSNTREQRKIKMIPHIQSTLTTKELRSFSNLVSPFKIQEFLDFIPYSEEERYRCPRSVLRDNKAHCYDGAVFAAAALRFIGYPPLLVEILPNDRDDDHILAVFQKGKYWGAVAKSNFVGLRYREPVYRDLRELIMSYFESYFNVAGERTLIGYTAPLNVNRFDKLEWLVNDNAMHAIALGLDSKRKFNIITPAMARQLSAVDKRSYQAGLLGANHKGLFQP